VAPLKVLDLFAGCGGLAFGFDSTRLFSTVLGVEMDADAAATFGLNIRCAIEARPIEEVRSFGGQEIDVVVGGPPCQPFSLLNRHGAGSERRLLWKEYVRVLRQTDASAFVMENVPGLLRSPEYLEFRASLGKNFSVIQGVLDAADYGVPQHRKRAIVIGCKDTVVALPSPTHGNPDALQLGRSRWKTFREAVRGLPDRPNGINWHSPRSPHADSIIRYRAVPKDGGNRFQMQDALDAQGLGHLVPRCWRNKPSGTTDVFGRLWWDKPSVTIRTEFYKPEKGRYLHPSEDRPITLREAARLMTFPDSFRFPEGQSMTSVGRQIGNAVPPDLAAAIARTLARSLGVGESDEPKAARSALQRG
jgi:DNA (cytosine-5)-methyltransferase 1